MKYTFKFITQCTMEVEADNCAQAVERFSESEAPFREAVMGYDELTVTAIRDGRGKSHLIKQSGKCPADGRRR